MATSVSGLSGAHCTKEPHDDQPIITTKSPCAMYEDKGRWLSGCGCATGFLLEKRELAPHLVCTRCHWHRPCNWAILMKILHTADWHLGHQLHGHDRRFEHAAFLDWLSETL
ncbi:MAG: hypothetical protein ACRC9V_07350, partial [Aeromonas sp.]